MQVGGIFSLRAEPFSIRARWLVHPLVPNSVRYKQGATLPRPTASLEEIRRVSGPYRRLSLVAAVFGAIACLSPAAAAGTPVPSVAARCRRRRRAHSPRRTVSSRPKTCAATAMSRRSTSSAAGRTSIGGLRPVPPSFARRARLIPIRRVRSCAARLPGALRRQRRRRAAQPSNLVDLNIG